MKKFIITAVAATALAVPAVASAGGGAYTQPGYPVSDAVSCNADHGAFGYMGAQGERHDLGQGDTMGDDKLGASPLTGPYQKAAAAACKTLR